MSVILSRSKALLLFALSFVCSASLAGESERTAKEVAIPAMPKCDSSMDYVKLIDEWKRLHLPPEERETYPCKEKWRSICQELRIIRKEDQRFRLKNPDPQMIERMAEADRRNFRYLRDFLRKYGIPDQREIGTEAEETIYLLVMHAPDLEFQEEILPQFRSAAQAGKIRRERIAYLEDRVRESKGQPTLFGTQFTCDPTTGQLVPAPVEEPEKLDERRTRYGLYPFFLYACAVQRELPHACAATDVPNRSRQ